MAATVKKYVTHEELEATLKARFEQLVTRQDFERQSIRVEVLSSDLHHLTNIVGDMAEDLVEMKADIAELKTDVAVLKTDVAVLKTDVAVLKTDVAVLKTDVAVLKTDVAVLKTDVADIKRDMNSNFATVMSILNQLVSQQRN